MSLPLFIKKFVPPKIKVLVRKSKIAFREIRNHNYHLYRYLKYSPLLGRDGKDKSLAFIIRELHAVEKGLSLNNPKPYFGQSRIQELLDEVVSFREKYGTNEYIIAAIITCKKYSDYNSQYKEVNPPSSNERISNMTKELFVTIGNNNFDEYGGMKTIKRAELYWRDKIPFREFVNSRYSIRDYTPEPVEHEKIMEAVEISLKTPSVCNRQGWRVHVYSDREKMDRILSIQNGNRGFREIIPLVLVVTGKLSSYFEKEGHQVFVDGGLFSMTLIYSLHSFGLGTCCLNACFDSKQDKEFRAAADLKNYEVPIMLIAVGHLKDVTKVAISKRNLVHDMIVFH